MLSNTFLPYPYPMHHCFSSSSLISVPNLMKPPPFDSYQSGQHSDTTSRMLQPKSTYIWLWEVCTTLDQCLLSFFAFSIFSAHLWLGSIPLCSSTSVACSLPSESHPELRFYLVCIFHSILAIVIAFFLPFAFLSTLCSLLGPDNRDSFPPSFPTVLSRLPARLPSL